MNFKRLLEKLCAFDYENEWLEFKENWFEAEELGKYISALANAAALVNKKWTLHKVVNLGSVLKTGAGAEK